MIASTTLTTMQVAEGLEEGGGGVGGGGRDFPMFAKGSWQLYS